MQIGRPVQNRAVKEKVLAARPERAEQRIAKLTANLPSESDLIQKTIAERLRSFSHSNPDATKGAAVFEKNCAACHQLRGRGGLVAPQLDGIGNRGLERILEDVLDPNRNVDAAVCTLLKPRLMPLLWLMS